MNALRWFDAHLDLACIALEGRDMTAADPRTAGGASPPGAITLPTLRQGRVAAALATVFFEPGGTTPAISYTIGDAESAHAAGARQIEVYRAWEARGLASIGRFTPEAVRTSGDAPPRFGILIEGADCVRTPAELSWWKERGAVAMGLAWAKQTRYAGGNTCETGLTDLGREMIKEMDRLGVVHDASHLSDRSLSELFERTGKVVIASHSNCRGILDDGSLELGPRQRHLTDDAIREIGRRGGVIGSVLYSPFIIRGGKAGAAGRRATLDEWYAHVLRICDLLGNRRQIGLGSDADGGFSADTLPEGINRPADYRLLAETLSAKGWTDAEVEGFAWGNWVRFWSAQGR